MLFSYCERPSFTPTRNWQNMVLHILTYTFLDSTQEDKWFWADWHQVFSKLFSECLCACNFDLLVLFTSTYLNLPHLQSMYLLSLCYAFVLLSGNVTLRE
jgi:hypothetical protein